MIRLLDCLDMTAAVDWGLNHKTKRTLLDFTILIIYFGKTVVSIGPDKGNILA